MGSLKKVLALYLCRCESLGESQTCFKNMVAETVRSTGPRPYGAAMEGLGNKQTPGHLRPQAQLPVCA